MAPMPHAPLRFERADMLGDCVVMTCTLRASAERASAMAVSDDAKEVMGGGGGEVVLWRSTKSWVDSHA